MLMRNSPQLRGAGKTGERVAPLPVNRSSAIVKKGQTVSSRNANNRAQVKVPSMPLKAPGDSQDVLQSESSEDE